MTYDSREELVKTLIQAGWSFDKKAGCFGMSNDGAFIALDESGNPGFDLVGILDDMGNPCWYEPQNIDIRERGETIEVVIEISR